MFDISIYNITTSNFDFLILFDIDSFNSIEEFLEEKMLEYSYIILFIWSFLEGEVGLVTAGIMSHYGKINPFIAIIVAGLGAFTSDMVFFLLGRYKKKWIRKKLTNQRRKFARAQLLLTKYGGVIIFFQRYVYGLRTVIPITIGITSYSIKKFIIIDIISALLWACVTIIPAYIFGDKLIELILLLKSHWYYIIPLVILITIMYFYYKKRRKER